MIKKVSALFFVLLIYVSFVITIPLSALETKDNVKVYYVDNDIICIEEEEETKESEYFDSKGQEPLTKTTKKYTYTYKASDGTYLCTLTVNVTGYYSVSLSTSSVTSISTSKSGPYTTDYSTTVSKSGNRGYVNVYHSGSFVIGYTYTLSTSGVWSSSSWF